MVYLKLDQKSLDNKLKKRKSKGQRDVDEVALDKVASNEKTTHQDCHAQYHLTDKVPHFCEQYKIQKKLPHKESKDYSFFPLLNLPDILDIQPKWNRV